MSAGKTGNFGLASTFSFFVAHHMSSIEGGMICTDDEELAEMLRIVRANGWDRNLTSEQQIRLRKNMVSNQNLMLNTLFTILDSIFVLPKLQVLLVNTNYNS